MFISVCRSSAFLKWRLQTSGPLWSWELFPLTQAYVFWKLCLHYQCFLGYIFPPTGDSKGVSSSLLVLDVSLLCPGLMAARDLTHKLGTHFILFMVDNVLPLLPASSPLLSGFLTNRTPPPPQNLLVPLCLEDFCLLLFYCEILLCILIVFPSGSALSKNIYLFVDN